MKLWKHGNLRLGSVQKAGCIALILTSGAKAISQTNQPVVPSKPTATSQGLVNDWLREQSSAFKPWNVGGQFRARYEVKENAGSFANRDFAENLDASNDFFLFRTKTHLGWSPVNWFNAFVEGRDSHVVSDDRAVTETDDFDLHQSYLRFGDVKKFPLLLTVGRQELVYGDERYVGRGDWSNTGRSFDAAKLRFENESFWVDAFAGRVIIPRDNHFNTANDYDWFSGLYVSTRKLVPWQETDVYLLARNVTPGSPTAITPTLGGPGARDIYTVGTRWKSLPGKLGGWDYAFEAAGQFGSINQSGVRRDHRAYAVNAISGYTWKDASGAPRFGVGYDFGSGDSNPTDGENETFELLFGTNHRLYGNMDLMGLRNLHIPRLEASIKPIKNLTVSVEWLGFWMAEKADFLYPESGAGRSANGYNRNPGFDSFVGHEVDLLVDWRVTSWSLVRLGYGHFFVGDYIKQSINSVPANGGTTDADWFYAQVSFNF